MNLARPAALAALLLTTALLPAPTSARQTEAGAGILYGTNHAFGFVAPKGWVLDTQVAADLGVYAAFYPKGTTWQNSRAVAYARARDRTAAIQTGDDVARDTVAEFRRDGNPHEKTRFAGAIRAGKTIGRMFYFTGDRYGNYEAAVYFAERKTINFFVLTARDKWEFERSLPAFRALTASYVFVSDAAHEDTKIEGTPN